VSRPKTFACPDCEGQGWHKDPDVTGEKIRCLRCYGIGRLSPEAVTMGELASHVGEHLPRNWLLKIEIEREAGWVSLFDPDGVEVTYPSNLETVEEMVVDALECAMGTETPP
jgi:hypothetical protein